MLITRRNTRLAATLVGLVLACVGVPSASIAQQYGYRFVIDFDVRCHEAPSLTSRTGQLLPITATPSARLVVEVAGADWYHVPQMSSQDSACWVYGPSTVEADPNDNLPSWLSMLEHQIARNEVPFEDYVRLDNLLLDPDRRNIYGQRQLLDSDLLRFKMLQLLERALLHPQGDGDVVGADPFNKAWMIAHQDLVVYFSPSGEWSVRAKPYWDLFDRNSTAAWADDLAWVASQHQPGTDDCDLDCLLQAHVVDGPSRYWSRFPRGAHIAEALKEPLDLLKYAADTVCSAKRSGTPVQPEDKPVSHSVTEEIRTSLAKVSDANRAAFLGYLDQIEGKCGR